MKCRHCSAELSLQMVDLGAAPPSNAFLSDSKEVETHYPLRVLVCESCWLVQTDISLFKLNYDELFTSAYPYFSSTSTSWVKHAHDYVDMATRRFGREGKLGNVVEIGSNDGYLLQFVKGRCYGIEPTNTSDIAIAKGITTVKVFFTEEVAHRIRHCYIGQRADLLICNNVLAHVPDINDFVRGCAVLLNDTGVATFEFPHLLNLVQKNQFDTIYHEHYSYLSLTSVMNIFTANGLHIFDVEKLQTHGGSLRVYAHNDVTAHKFEKRVLELLDEEKESGMLTPEFYVGFQDKVDNVKNDFIHFMNSCRTFGRSVVGFGAAAKGNTFLNYVGIRPDQIPYVVDETPSKQGKFLPGSRIPVQAKFTTKPDCVVVFPWNFKQEIMYKHSYIRDWGGKFVFAVPHMEVL